MGEISRVEMVMKGVTTEPIVGNDDRLGARAELSNSVNSKPTNKGSGDTEEISKKEKKMKPVIGEPTSDDSTSSKLINKGSAKSLRASVINCIRYIEHSLATPFHESFFAPEFIWL